MRQRQTELSASDPILDTVGTLANGSFRVVTRSARSSGMRASAVREWSNGLIKGAVRPEQSSPDFVRAVSSESSRTDAQRLEPPQPPQSARIGAEAAVEEHSGPATPHGRIFCLDLAYRHDLR